MSEEDEENLESNLTWDELILSSTSIPSSVLYWRYRRLFHEQYPLPSVKTSVSNRLPFSYSPSGRWALYAFNMKTRVDEPSYLSVYRVIPIGYSDGVALHHQLSFIKLQQQLISPSSSSSSSSSPPPSSRFDDGSRLSLKECFDEPRAMGDLLAVPHNPSLSSSSSSRRWSSFPIWRYLIESAHRQPSWHPDEPSTLIVAHYNNIIEDQQRIPPLPTSSSSGDGGESNQQYARPATVTATPTVERTTSYHYRLPQRDIDKSIWIAMIVKGTFGILLMPLIEIIFEYSDS
jgi:hypothetical protein